jgi:hypothetical protein
MRPGLRAAALGLAAVAAAGCGYAFSTRWAGKGGADRVDVRPIENLSAEPGLGPVMTDALRTSIARRGASGDGGARIEGEVRTRPPAPSSPGGATWTIGVLLKARLVVDGRVTAEGSFAREVEYLSGADPVETEGRRALALRRLADEVALEVLTAFER